MYGVVVKINMFLHVSGSCVTGSSSTIDKCTIASRTVGPYLRKDVLLAEFDNVNRLYRILLRLKAICGQGRIDISGSDVPICGKFVSISCMR